MHVFLPWEDSSARILEMHGFEYWQCHRKTTYFLAIRNHFPVPANDNRNIHQTTYKWEQCLSQWKTTLPMYRLLPLAVTFFNHKNGTRRGLHQCMLKAWIAKFVLSRRLQCSVNVVGSLRRVFIGRNVIMHKEAKTTHTRVKSCYICLYGQVICGWQQS